MRRQYYDIPGLGPDLCEIPIAIFVAAKAMRKYEQWLGVLTHRIVDFQWNISIASCIVQRDRVDRFDFIPSRVGRTGSIRDQNARNHCSDRPSNVTTSHTSHLSKL